MLPFDILQGDEAHSYVAVVRARDQPQIWTKTYDRPDDRIDGRRTGRDARTRYRLLFAGRPRA